MVTDILLALILIVLLLAMAQRGYYALKQLDAFTAHTAAMADLSGVLNTFIDEIRSVQTYGLRVQK